MLDATALALEPFQDIEEPQAIVEQPTELAVQCVLYVGDILTTRQKQAPANRLGGKQFPLQDFRTVPNSVLQQCSITRLRKAFRSVHKNMVDKEKWEGYIPSYTLKNQWNPAKSQYEDVVVGKEGLLYKPIRPIHELGRIAGQQNGAVALDEAAGINSGDDIKEAQLFYFPNWYKIVAQEETLFERLSELQDHIETRRALAHSNEMRAIGDAYLLAISDYFDWGKAYVDFQTNVIKETEKFPGGARYDEVAERLFRVLGLQREDKLIVDMARGQTNSEQTNALLVQLLAKMDAKGDKTDSIIESMVGVLQDRIVAPESVQAPAPVTVAEAKAELARAVEDDVAVDSFVDMSEVVVEPVETSTKGRKEQKNG